MPVFKIRFGGHFSLQWFLQRTGRRGAATDAGLWKLFDVIVCCMDREIDKAVPKIMIIHLYSWNETPGLHTRCCLFYGVLIRVVGRSGSFSHLLDLAAFAILVSLAVRFPYCPDTGAAKAWISLKNVFVSAAEYSPIQKVCDKLSESGHCILGDVGFLSDDILAVRAFTAWKSDLEDFIMMSLLPKNFPPILEFCVPVCFSLYCRLAFQE